MPYCVLKTVGLQETYQRLRYGILAGLTEAVIWTNQLVRNSVVYLFPGNTLSLSVSEHTYYHFQQMPCSTESTVVVTGGIRKTHFWEAVMGSIFI